MIAILMATYNGEKYLAEQIASILRQTEQDFTLHIRDDASTDGTLAIAQRFAASHPGKISVYANDANTGSSKANFMRMIAETQDDYVMLCDQDDVWLDTKVADTLRCMRALEAEHGRDVPLLVHTDLRVVDADLREVAPSLFESTGVHYQRRAPHEIIVQNNGAGCTMLYNRALAARLAGVSGDGCAMHDWWVMLAASVFGHIGVLKEGTILYRQHGENVVGAKDTRSLRYLLRVVGPGPMRENLAATYRQAAAFLAAYGDAMTPEVRGLFTGYAALGDMRGKLTRLKTAQRLGTWKAGTGKKLLQMVWV